MDSPSFSSSPSHSSLSSNSRFMHDVFINFNREDTSKTFVSDLDVALFKAGIESYIDYHLHKGTDLDPELLEAIEDARISIIVFSKNYAESSWCLDELQKVMECRRTIGQFVVPVFYDVNSSDIRHQKGDFGQALRDTAKEVYFRWEGEKKMENVLSNWSTALTQAANLSGWHVHNSRYQDELMQEIVETVLRKLKRESLFIASFPVGLESYVQEVTDLIENHSGEVCLIGICGMGGSGKTTAAKSIYNQIHWNFMNRSFIENVREVCEENIGIIQLQQQLLSDIMNKNVMIRSTEYGKMMISDLRGTKVLVVLDDVTTLEQLTALCAKPKLFGPGSVFIVTTRDASLLRLIKADYVYTVKELGENESLELFSWHAFRQPIPKKKFSEISRNVVAYCGGLPLALEVIGSNLYERSKEEWESMLLKLERIPHQELQQKMRLSYDGLMDDMEKDMFLDICCFFIGKDRSYVTKILNGCGFFAEIGIAVLIERNLVKIEKNNKLGMHDLIRDMGREIVRESSASKPGKRSRLWFHEDVHHILTTNSGTEVVEGLVLKSESTGRVRFGTYSFKKMKELRLLQLDGVDLNGNYGNLSKNLRWLHWRGFTLNYIPDEFYLRNLVVIELKHSNIKKVWNKTQMLVNLKILNLSHSRYLNRSPDFSKIPNLEKLIMKGCPSLSKIHPSIGDLNNLLLINLKDCTGLSHLPKKIYQLKSLETLILSGCSKLDKLEEDIMQMESLATLLADNTAVKEVPFSIARSKSIDYISLSGYEGFSRDVLPSLIWTWMSPTMRSLPYISPFRNITYYLASIDVQKNKLGFLSPTVSSLLQLRIIGVRFRSKIQLTQELRRILDDQYDVRFAEVETSHAPQISNLSLRSLLIGMGSFHMVIDTLSKSISQVPFLSSWLF